MWLSKASTALDKVTIPVSRASNWIAAGVLAVMMFFTTADVVGRYVFSAPIAGDLEITEFMLAITVFLALAYTAIQKGHVAVDLVTSRLTPRGQAITSGITSLLGLVLFSLMIWQTSQHALWVEGTGGESHILHLSLLPFILLAAFGVLLLALVLLSDFLGYLSKALENSRWQPRLWLASGSILALLLVASPIWSQQMGWQISPLIAGIIGIVALFILMLSGMPIAFVMILVGYLGIEYVRGMDAAFRVLGSLPYRSCSSYAMSVLPLFVLMGAFAFHSQLSRALYEAAYRWIGRTPGGMAMATIVGCAGFAAICGDNVATAVTMGTVALPEMKRYKYDPALATGTIAAGGTLGVLIPPSLAFILYALLTEQSIGALFLAGIFPGILLASLMMLTVYIICRRNPLAGPPGPQTSLRDKIVSLRGIWGILALFVLVMGGIYLGVFTPTEGAGIGAFGAFAYTLITRRFSWRNFVISLLDTVKTSAMALFILVGATVFGTFMAVSTLPTELANFAAALPLPPLVIFVFILIVFVVLGCLMSAIAMLLLTLPIFYPVIMGLGFDPIWTGVIMVLMWNIACITPPVGITVFVIKGVAPEVPLYSIFRGIIPFLIAMIVCVIILIAFPEIATFLPKVLM